MVIHASHHVVLLSIHVWHYYIEIIKKKWVMSFLWVPRLHQSNYLSQYVQVIFLSLRHNYIACFIICTSWCSCNLITLLMWSRTTRPFVEPLLKSTLDPNFYFFLNTICQISKLSKIAPGQLMDHVSCRFSTWLFDIFQSSCRMGHSTVTAPPRDLTVTLLEAGNHQTSIPFLLNGTAAFDSAHHVVFIERGISGTVFAWLLHYLSNRKLCVATSHFSILTISNIIRHSYVKSIISTFVFRRLLTKSNRGTATCICIFSCFMPFKALCNLFLKIAM